jgi:hypothetical protein
VQIETILHRRYGFVNNAKQFSCNIYGTLFRSPSKFHGISIAVSWNILSMVFRFRKSAFFFAQNPKR